jgi:hypothetical protein
MGSFLLPPPLRLAKSSSRIVVVVFGKTRLFNSLYFGQWNHVFSCLKEFEPMRTLLKNSKSDLSKRGRITNFLALLSEKKK